jgi:hypothetical protein
MLHKVMLINRREKMKLFLKKVLVKERVMKKIVLVMMAFISSLHADCVVVGRNYTTPGIIDGDLIIDGGSLVISSPGDMVVNGDVKISSGFIFMAPGTGQLRVFGDVVVTNTGGSASIVTHNAIEVSGALVTHSTYGQANITTTGGGSLGIISAERIATDGLMDAGIYTQSNLTVVAEVDLRSSMSSAALQVAQQYSPVILTAGRVVINAYDDGSIRAGKVNIIGDIYAYSQTSSTEITASNENIYARSITTSAYWDSPLIAMGGIEVPGNIRLIGVHDNAVVTALGSSITAGSLMSDAYYDVAVTAVGDILANGDIILKSSNGAASIYSTYGSLIALSIATKAPYGDASIDALTDINVRRSISTDGLYDAYVYSDAGNILALSITTSAGANASVDANKSVLVKRNITTNSVNERANVFCARGDICASDISSTASMDASVQAMHDLVVNDGIQTKSFWTDAQVHAQENISARFISTNALHDAHVAVVNGSINVTGDIETQTASSLGSVTANDGNLFARSIKEINGSSAIGATQGAFKVFPDQNATYLDIKNSEFYLDADRVWNTQLDVYGSCTLNGNGKLLQFGTGGGIVVTPGATLYLNNIVLDNVAGTAIRCYDNASTLSLNHVTWNQAGDVTWAYGSLQFFGDCILAGPGTSFSYDCAATSTIHTNSNFVIDKGVTFKYNAASANQLVMLDATSILKFNGGLLQVMQDLQLTQGTLALDDYVKFTMDSGKTLYFGDGLGDNLLLDFYLGFQWDVLGALVNNNVDAG